jgi:hypothetical protein
MPIVRPVELFRGGVMAVHINFGPELEEVVRRPDGEERWCFKCRAKRRFEYVVLAPIEMSHYGPTPMIECATCHLTDADLFPGRQREWSD